MKFYVLIPVYKAEAFLPDCLHSVFAQSWQDFEIVLVDDGSPDGSGKLCDAYAAQDARIHALHQENTGPYGAGRPSGMPWTTGRRTTGPSFWTRTTV